MRRSVSIVVALVLLSISVPAQRGSDRIVSPQDLGRIWDAERVSPPLPPLLTHAEVTRRLEAVVAGAPDLVAEILSPSTAHLDHTTKLVEYARAGVREYWIVDPEEYSVVVFTLDGDAFRVAGAIFSGGIIGVGMFAEAKIAVNAIFGIE